MGAAAGADKVCGGCQKKKCLCSPFFFLPRATTGDTLDNVVRDGEGGVERGGMTLEEEREVVYTGGGSPQAVSGN